MSSRLVSSVLTGDQHLHNFFHSTSGLMTPPQTPTVVNGSTTPNPFASAFSSAITNGSSGSGGGLSTSSSGVMVENGLAGEGLAGAYRKRKESGNGDAGGELVVGCPPPAGLDTLSAISAISAISPAISTPKSSRSSSVSTLVGSGSIRTGPSDAETVRNLKVRYFTVVAVV